VKRGSGYDFPVILSREILREKSECVRNNATSDVHRSPKETTDRCVAKCRFPFCRLGAISAPANICSIKGSKIGNRFLLGFDAL
jgi:hypothetical protein